MKWITNERTFAERLIAFIAVEGLFFSSSFAVIFAFKERGRMPGLCQSNDLISRDEGLHTDFACCLLKHLRNRLATSNVENIIREAVDIECAFAQGMGSDDVFKQALAHKLSPQSPYSLHR
jgi:ribonucleoside-diphosphate reductase subunit M2